MIYLDHQATTPVAPEVWAAMEPFFRESFGNPASLHRHGLAARQAMNTAREHIAALIHAESIEEILFTSGGTESINLAIKGAAEAHRRLGRHIVLTATDHPAVLSSTEYLETQGFTRTIVPVNPEGFVDPEAIRAAMREDTILICVHHAGHDLGTLQPVREIGAIADVRGIPLFVDATASAGWEKIDVQEFGASLLALAPHRFYGPKGVGVLYRHRRARVAPLIHGGVQEGGRRAGTENVPGIVGAGVAAELAGRTMNQTIAHARSLQMQLAKGLADNVPFIRLNGPPPGPHRLANTLNYCVEFIEGEALALIADLQGIALASGAACVTKSARIPPALAAIGVPPELGRSNIMLSLGRTNTPSEIAEAVQILPKLVTRLREMSPAWEAFQRGERNSLTAPRPG